MDDKISASTSLHQVKDESEPLAKKIKADTKCNLNTETKTESCDMVKDVNTTTKQGRKMKLSERTAKLKKGKAILYLLYVLIQGKMY